MSVRHPNHRLIKIHRCYAVEEISNLLGKHKNTVRSWLRHGLMAIDDKRPTLIKGSTLADFLKGRRKRNKQPLQPGEICCVRCRVAVKPAGEMADCLHISTTIGNLRGICPHCDLLIHRRVSLAKIDKVTGELEVTFERAGPRIGESVDPSFNCDFEQGAQTDEKS